MKLVFRAVFFTFLSLFFCQNALAFTPNPTQPVDKFLSVADIHFNPFLSCAVFTVKVCPLIAQLRQAGYQDWEKIFEQSDSKIPSTYHEDTNYALLKSSHNTANRIFQ